MTAYPIMVDGISPDVDAIYARYPGNPVACYCDGEYAWSPAQEHLFGRKIRITVEANLTEAAEHARCIDVENGAATPADVRPFLEAHAKLGFSNGTVYCSAANVRNVVEAVHGFTIPRWWVAWYWGKPGYPTAAQVLAEVRRLTGVNLPEASLWACQYANYPQWDLSVVYGKPDFAHH